MEIIRTQVLLTPELHKKAKLVGVETGQSLSNLVRDALEVYLALLERTQKRDSVINKTIGSIKANESGWKGIDLQGYLKDIRRDKK